MASVNRVILVGNLGRDPETRYLASGDCVCNFSIATSETWKDKATGEKKEQTEWHRIVTFRKLAEIANEYLKKGTSVYIEGKIQTKKWQDKEGNDRYSTEIIADKMTMLGSKQADGGNPDGAPADPPAQRASTSPEVKAEQQQRAAQGGGAFDDFNDNIPF